MGRKTDLAVSSLSFEECKEITRRRHPDAYVDWPTPLHKPDWLVFRIQTLSWLCRLSLNVLCIAGPHLAANEFLKLIAFFPRLRAVISFVLIRRDLMFYILRFNFVPPCPFSFTSASSDSSFAPQTSNRTVALLVYPSVLCLSLLSHFPSLFTSPFLSTGFEFPGSRYGLLYDGLQPCQFVWTLLPASFNPESQLLWSQYASIRMTSQWMLYT
jgi:hypothetical protein